MLTARAARSTPRTRTVAVLAGSVLVLVLVIVLTVDYGLSIRATYGAGIDPALGSQVQRDFLIDQDAEAAALSKLDESLLSNRLSDAALADLVQQIHDQANASAALKFSFQPSSITVLRAQDPNDPSLLIQVQEEGVKTVTTSSRDSAPSEEAFNFHGDFWLRPVSGRYLIADQNIQIQPTSYLPQIALVLLGLLWVGTASVLMRRVRAQPASPGARGPHDETFPTPRSATQPSRVDEGPAPAAKTVVRTFGGLQVIEDGKDWAPALSSRPVMGFVWRRMLLSAVRDRNATVTREEISRQASPGLDRETQLKRLRNLIYQGLRELPPSLRTRISVEPQVLRFELADTAVDAIEVLDVAAECAGRTLLSTMQAERAQRALDSSIGPFLPEFESVEDLATDHHPTCTELITGLRQQLSTKRAEISLVLADTYIAEQRPSQAIAVLEPALKEHPSRKDLAERLASAYRAAGRDAEARGLAELNK